MCYYVKERIEKECDEEIWGGENGAERVKLSF